MRMCICAYKCMYKHLYAHVSIITLGRVRDIMSVKNTNPPTNMRYFNTLKYVSTDYIYTYSLWVIDFSEFIYISTEIYTKSLECLKTMWGRCGQYPHGQGETSL